MRIGEIASKELAVEGRRLNGGFFLTEDEQAFRILRKWTGRTRTLESLAEQGGIYTGGIFRKLSVASAEYGLPYVSARDITRAEVRPNGYLSHKHGSLLSLLTLREGMILITCSGMNLGETIWVRGDMDGLAGSGDLIRVRLDKTEISPGYVFAFLNSKYGHVSIRKLIYGGHIRHISPKDVGGISIPRLPLEVEMRAGALITEAASVRASATAILQEVCSDVLLHLKAPRGAAHRSSELVAHAVSHGVLANERRLEAYFYNRSAMAASEWAASHPNGNWLLGEVADVYDVPPFKHIYVGSDRGVPFFTSGELFNLDRSPQKFLSKTQTHGLEKYVISKAWVLLARSGQLGGLLGRPLYAASDLDQVCVSDHLIRVVAKSDVPSGYLYAYLATEALGYVLLTRTMAGASVPALWPIYLKKIPIVKAEAGFMSAIHERVEKASEMRVAASAKETAARSLVERAIEGTV